MSNSLPKIAADISSPVGLYPIMGSGLTAGNYIFIQANLNSFALNVTAVPVPPTPPSMLPVASPNIVFPD